MVSKSKKCLLTNQPQNKLTNNLTTKWMIQLLLLEIEGSLAMPKPSIKSYVCSAGASPHI
jgi:hypothetical protein